MQAIHPISVVKDMTSYKMFFKVVFYFISVLKKCELLWFLLLKCSSFVMFTMHSCYSKTKTPRCCRKSLCYSTHL